MFSKSTTTRIDVFFVCLVAGGFLAMCFAGLIMQDRKIKSLQRQNEMAHHPEVQRAVAAWDELTTPPTVAQLQQMLAMRGYELQIDGRLGPETIRAWQQWECDAAAVRALGAGKDAQRTTAVEVGHE